MAARAGRFSNSKGSTAHGSFHDIDFVDANHGWAAGSNTAMPYGQPMVGVTGDGGVTWKLVALSHSAGTVNAISFADAKHGWAVVWWGNANYLPSGGASIFVTRDGGLTWRQQFKGSPTFTVSDVCFVDAERGWAGRRAAGQERRLRHSRARRTEGSRGLGSTCRPSGRRRASG